MTTDREARNHGAVKLEAELRAHLAASAATAPIIVEALTEALRDGGADMAYDLIASIMPRRVDPWGMQLWFTGGPPPSPVKLLDPDAGRSPKARGERHMALAKVAEAQRGIDKCKERLAEAEDKLARCASDLEEADDRNRNVAIHLLLGHIARENAVSLRLGPIYSLARAISPYLQVDPAYETELSPEQAEALAKRREARPGECREILDLLDRYAGDPRLEINLQREILKVVRDHHQRFQDHIDKRRAEGIKSTDRMKRRAIRRSFEEMKAGVHPAAPLADIADVFSAIDDAFMGPRDTDSTKAGQHVGNDAVD